MACKKSELSADVLSTLASSYKRLLAKAIRCTSQNDQVSVQRLAAGINALSKAVATVARVKKTENQALKFEID